MHVQDIAAIFNKQLASTVLSKIDAKLDSDDQGEEGEESAEQQQQQQQQDEEEEEEGNPRDPLLPPNAATTTTLGTAMSSTQNNRQVFVDTDGNVIAGNFSSTGIIASPAGEAARLASHEETYLEPLHVDSDEEFVELRVFLASFHIDEKTKKFL